MEKLKLALTFTLMIGVIGGLLYWVSNTAENNKNSRVSHVEGSYRYSKGVITRKHSYKGHSITIKYKIDDLEHEYTGGWDNNPQNLGIGDSILFKYSINNPELIITELEEGY